MQLELEELDRLKIQKLAEMEIAQELEDEVEAQSTVKYADESMDGNNDTGPFDDQEAMEGGNVDTDIEMNPSEENTPKKAPAKQSLVSSQLYDPMSGD